MTKQKWIITLIVLGGIIAGGYFAATRSLDHFLANGTLARLIGQKTAVKLEADVGYLPFTWHGMAIQSDGILVRGQPPRALAEMRAVNLRAYCSLQNLWQRKWTITRLQASHLQAAFGPAAAAQLEKLLPDEPQLQAQVETASPLKIDIRETLVPRTDIFWGEMQDAVGWLKDVEARFYPKEHNLDAFGRGGTFRQTGWPELKVEALQLHYTKPKLTVQSATFLLGQTGEILVTGDFDFGEGGMMHLVLHGTNAPAEAFLTGFWRDKFQGVFDFETTLEKRFHADEKVKANGEVRFLHAVVHDVAMLKQIAAVTRHPQFEKPKIDVLHLRYFWSGERLEVTEFEAETKGLLRLEGTFSIEKENIDARLKVGAAADVVESLPGAREKVFTESRDEYLWTTMTLQGPMSHPREDLKPRLVAAVKEHFGKGLLAPIFKPGKAMLELLDAIYK